MIYQKKANRINCLSIKNPLVSKEWNYEKNEKLTPKNITASSGKKVWWKCKKGHEWIASVAHRNNGRSCPYCSNKLANSENCISNKKPELLAEWNYERNIDPDKIVYGSSKKVWWKCNKGHEWQASVRNRYMGQGCPYCCKHPKMIDITNCLLTKNPELAKEWHPTKNGKLIPKNVAHFSSKKVWWKCKNEHSWKAAIYSRVSGNGCPYCSGQKVYKGNCLLKLEPLLSKEWNYKKNGKLTPNDITCHSHKKVWWKCKKGHEWISSVSNRTGANRRKCPKCRGVILKDGTHCSSIPEAYMYLKYKNYKLNFHHNKLYGKELGKMRYDFYFPDQNKYVEITSFAIYNITNKRWNNYMARISKKKKYVENVINAKFEFIQFVPTRDQIKYVENNSIFC